MLPAIALGALLPWCVRRFAANERLPVWLGIVATLGVAAWSAVVIPPTMLLAATLLLGWALLVLATIDAAVYRLPDLFTYPLGLLGLVLVYRISPEDLAGHVIGAAAGIALFVAIALTYRLLRKRDGLGLGDAKLVGVAGAWLGWEALPSVVLFGALGGLALYGVAALRRGSAALAEPIPFGVPLAFAIWLCWLYGPIL